MKCPFCGNNDTRVIDSRPVEGGNALRRRRLCDQCDGRFTTHERIALFPLFVIKKDGRREEFQVEKLRNGIANACNKRPVAVDDINQLVEEVEQHLRQEAKSEVDSYIVGELVMERLFQLDQVAYVRFASVYQRFDDVRRFAQLLERMTRSAKRSKKGASTSTPASTELSDPTSTEEMKPHDATMASEIELAPDTE